MSPPARILVVSVGETLRELARTRLPALGHAVAIAADADDAVRVAAEEPPDIALVDVHAGLGLIERLAGIPVVAVTDRPGIEPALAAGAFDVLLTPIEAGELAARCGAALRARELASAALVDEVTGAANHRRALQELGRMVASARRNGRPVSVVICDLDGFSAVNAEYGRTCGDQILSEAAVRVSGALRAGDLAARLGGDIFLVLLADAPPAQVALVCDRLRRAVEEAPFRLAAGSVALTASVGWAAWEGEDPELLLDRADHALAAAKAAGGNAVHPLL